MIVKTGFRVRLYQRTISSHIGANDFLIGSSSIERTFALTYRAFHIQSKARMQQPVESRFG